MKTKKLIYLAILLLVSGITGINAQQDADFLVEKADLARRMYREDKDKNLKENQIKDIMQLRNQLSTALGDKQTVRTSMLSETERKMKNEIYYLDVIISKEKTPEDWRKLFKEYVDIREEYLTDYFNNNDYSFRLRDKYLKRMEQLKRKIDTTIEKERDNPELNTLLSYKTLIGQSNDLEKKIYYMTTVLTTFNQPQPKIIVDSLRIIRDMGDKDAAVKMYRDLLKSYENKLLEECGRLSSDKEKYKAAMDSYRIIMDCLDRYVPSPLDYKITYRPRRVQMPW
ncbi:MAG: hypothetical protein LBS20_09640 [Prevotella sp.]|jgi:hypothetical protein|nr:hypothetical protein [Prevotella sp.]